MLPAPPGLLSRSLITASSATAVGTLLAARAETASLVDPATTPVTIHLSSTWDPQPARITAVYQFAGTDCDAAVRWPHSLCERDGVASLSARSAGTCVQRGAMIDVEAVLSQDGDPVERKLYGLANDAGGYYLYSRERAATGAAVEPSHPNLTWVEWFAEPSSVDGRGTTTHRFTYDLIYTDGVTPPIAGPAEGTLEAVATGRVAFRLDGDWLVYCFRSRGVVRRGRMVQGIAVIGTG
jgi:hypothetical protein